MSEIKKPASLYKMEERHIPFEHQEYSAEKKMSQEEQTNDLFGKEVLMQYDSLRCDIKKYLKLAGEDTVPRVDLGARKVNKRVMLKSGEEIPASEYYLGSAEEIRAKINELNSQESFKQLQEKFDILQKALEANPENSDRKNQENKQIKEDALYEMGVLLKPLTNEDAQVSLSRVGKIFNSIKNNEYSNTELLEVLKLHREYIFKKEKVLNEKIEVYKSEFKIKVEGMIENGELPKSALVHLGSIKIAKSNLIDYLTELTSGRLGSAKKCDGLLINSVLLEDKYENELKHVIYHEFIHILSGKGINLYSFADSDGELLKALTGSSKYSKRIKRGLVFQAYNYESKKFRNRSLDEATTELLTMLMLEDNNLDDNEDDRFQGSEFYVNERKKLNILLEKGLNKQTLFEAYFENVTSDQKMSGGFKHTGRLIQEMNNIDKGVYLRWNNESMMMLAVDLLASSSIFAVDKLPYDRDIDNKIVIKIFFYIGETKYTRVEKSLIFIPNGEIITEEEKGMVRMTFQEIQEYTGVKASGAKSIDLRGNIKE